MTGHSINILPVVVNVSKEEQLLEYLRKVWDIQTEWTRYEYTQVDKIYEWLGLPEDSPLFDNFVVIQNLGSVKGEIRGEARDTTGWVRTSELMFAKMEYPLRFDIFTGVEYCFIFQYYRRFFKTPAVKGLMDNLQILIENAIENPRQTVEELLKVVDKDKYKLYENESPEGFFQH